MRVPRELPVRTQQAPNFCWFVRILKMEERTPDREERGACFHVVKDLSRVERPVGRQTTEPTHLVDAPGFTTREQRKEVLHE